MNVNEPREPASTEGAQPDDEAVEVVVEDLFIEEYPRVMLSSDELTPAPRRHRVRNMMLAIGMLGAIGLAMVAVLRMGGMRGLERTLRRYV